MLGTFSLTIAKCKCSLNLVACLCTLQSVVIPQTSLYVANAQTCKSGGDGPPSVQCEDIACQAAMTLLFCMALLLVTDTAAPDYKPQHYQTFHYTSVNCCLCACCICRTAGSGGQRVVGIHPSTVHVYATLLQIVT